MAKIREVCAQRLYFWFAFMGVLPACAGPSEESRSLNAARSEVIALDAPTPVDDGPPSQRGDVCPGGRLADTCGTWAGVELKASYEHGPGGQRTGHAAEVCACAPIEFAIPSELSLHRGNADRHRAALSFRTPLGETVTCRYRGNGRRGNAGGAQGGDKYLFERCSDAGRPGDIRHGRWFSLELEGADRNAGIAEVRLTLGEADTVDGVVQEQVFYSSDARIPAAALYVPRGAAPMFQDFTLQVLEAVPSGTRIPNGGNGKTSVGYAIDVRAGTSEQFSFTPVLGASCARLEIPYDAAVLASIAAPASEARLSGDQLISVEAIANGGQAVTAGADVRVNRARRTVSFCVEHLSFYLPTVPAWAAALRAAKIVELEPPGREFELLASMLPDLTARRRHRLTLEFENLGSTAWTSLVDPSLVTVGVPSGTFPELSVSSLASSAWGPSTVSAFTNASAGTTKVSPGERARFELDVSAPAVPTTLNLCLRERGGTFFGTCFSWDPVTTRSDDAGEASPTLLEVCDGVDNDQDGGVDEDLAGCGETACFQPVATGSDPASSVGRSDLGCFVCDQDCSDGCDPLLCAVFALQYGSPWRGQVCYPGVPPGFEGEPWNTPPRMLQTPAPVVFMVHGGGLGERFGAFETLQRNLARFGIVSVSVDANGSLSREDAVIDAIRRFRWLNANPSTLHIFGNNLDFSKLGLVGHSLGGGAVARLPNLIRDLGLGFRVTGALAVGQHGSGPPAEDYALMRILPADSAQRVQDGAGEYDLSRPEPFKSQIYLASASHEGFDENDFTLEARDELAAMSVFGTAFFRHLLKLDDTRGFLDGSEILAPGTPNHLHNALRWQDVHVSFSIAGAFTVDDFEDSDPAHNVVGGSVTSSGIQALEAASSTTIDGAGKRLLLEGDGVYHSQLNQTLELAGQELWVRAAERADATLPAAPNSFTVGIVLSSGEVRWRSQVLPRITALRLSQGLGGGESYSARTVLKTFRFPASCFLLPGESSLPITGVQLRVAPGTWPVGFDDLQLVREGL